MYVAVKGGEKAISNAHRLLEYHRKNKDGTLPLSIKQIKQQLKFSVSRVMTEGSLFDENLAALSLKQAQGDCIEAIFLLRAYRTTLPRFGYSQAINTQKIRIKRRISAIYKDIPGGQFLGSTFDYTHRLLDFSLLDDEDLNEDIIDHQSTESSTLTNVPHVMKILENEGLLKEISADKENSTVPDLTREHLVFPLSREGRLQMLVRGDEGFLLSLAYSTQRGYGRNHPFVGEIRIGMVKVSFIPEELGFEVCLGEIEITECEMVNQFIKNADDEVRFTRGYGLTFGYSEKKAMAMALVDRALCSKEFKEEIISPAQQEEFVLSHCDNIEAAGFISHLKLPHYVDFQSELELIRKIRKEKNLSNNPIE